MKLSIAGSGEGTAVAQRERGLSDASAEVLSTIPVERDVIAGDALDKSGTETGAVEPYGRAGLCLVTGELTPHLPEIGATVQDLLSTEDHGERLFDGIAHAVATAALKQEDCEDILELFSKKAGEIKAGCLVGLSSAGLIHPLDRQWL